MKLPALFNPSNDMALAANVRQYFPPRRIQQMESDLEDLARLWDEGPWGWSLATRQRYLHMGIGADALPSEQWLAEVRRLSCRRFAVGYYRQLMADESLRDEPLLLPCLARYVEEESSIIQNLPHPIILKAPWSSSGRGNIVVQDTPDETTLRRIRHTLRQQGGIVAEPFYADKALDFAMEFWVGEDEVRFLGYSVFEADAAGHYGGNYVESQESLLRRIALPAPLLLSLVAHHRRALSALSYRGPVGIDMMRLRDGRVHPCVELNFRRTMGLLALTLYERGTTADCLLAGTPLHGFSASVADGKLSIQYSA